ncbi:unnamed protein product [Periconia digitata]|uniref:SnoaL-like domain-containing protein n=1 Tax=Periconia digitata TaxID=1303443 RepID=A0A9W4XQK3_9PLEO|nr:unnamed protein product [Periconia digitata]
METAKQPDPSCGVQSQQQPEQHKGKEQLRVSPRLTLQAPLSRRGHGPGVILVADHYAALKKSDASLDPPPLVKWAEEGFAVALLLVPGGADDGGEFPLQRAIDGLKGLEGCDHEGGFGLISYLSRVPYYVTEGVCACPDIKAIVSFGGRNFASFSPSSSDIAPQLIHIAGPETPRRESMSVVQNPLTSDLTSPPATTTSSSSSTTAKHTPPKTYRYLNAKSDSSWILPNDPSYHSQSAGLAHTRTLQFLKPLLNGPYFDLEAIWDEHCQYEFGERDVAKTMATMVSEPYVNHIPTMTGGIGKEALTAFYTNHFIFENPPDTALDLVSRTVGIDRVVDEFVFKLTHDRQVDWLLPGVPATGKYLEIPFTSVVGIRGDRLCHEHISWDQATALRQAGLLPEWVGFEADSVEGRTRGEGKRFEVKLPVAGVETVRKLVDEGAVESNGLMGKGWREVDDV